jgi:NAD(P)-dependent dehydrogenase (short-subunit alcohol dehydrogenase family)
MGQLDGRVAIVTGATSGIGERIAEVFVAEGARVVGAGRRTDEGEALSFVRTDVSKEVDVKAMIDHAVTRFGRLDCLVNNAGSGSPMLSIADVTEEQFLTVFGVNVLGVMLCIKHAAPINAPPGIGQPYHRGKRLGSAGGHGRSCLQQFKSGGDPSHAFSGRGTQPARHPGQ